MKQALPDYMRAAMTGAGGTSQPISPREFRALCYTAARITGGEVLGFDPPPFDSIKNFMLVAFRFSFRSDRQLIFLLLNHYVPLLACASAPDLAFRVPFAFIDIPELTAHFAHFCRILKKHELDCPWMWTQHDMEACLSSGEIKEINYWRPGTVGEAIFNFWD